MSDPIKHECGIAFMRLLKPLNFYRDHYNSTMWGVEKIESLMRKQSNRGQDGCGLVNIKMNVPPGTRYISRYRSTEKNPLDDIFNKLRSKLTNITEERLNNTEWLQNNIPFTGEIFLGHLRYGTYGLNNIENCHPFLRLNNWKSKNLTIAGNFNLTNVEDLFSELVDRGQHPKEKSDTVTILERIGNHLDIENDRLYNLYHKKSLSEKEIYNLIENNLNLETILKESSKDWDGGYVMCGIVGNGDSFILRDPHGIRPCYYFYNEDYFVAASERWAIQSSFGLDWSQIKELERGSAVIVKKDGSIHEVKINEPKQKRSCSFERIYFSKSNDPEIYQERKNLGFKLARQVLSKIDSLDKTIFSYIPQSSEVAFLGLVEELGRLTSNPIRIEKAIIKETKSRTFITNDGDRKKAVSSAYELGGLKIKNDETIVLVDDSIVRGTTLKDSIITMVKELSPKKIIIVSSCPQVRYPDCYGIDMVKISDMIAFQSAILLTKEQGNFDLIEKIYDLCKSEITKPKKIISNVVASVYNQFTQDQITDRIGQILSSGSVIPVEIIYPTIEDLHHSIPNHLGDWYFTGNYPTSGGVKVVNQSFINFFEGKDLRAY